MDIPDQLKCVECPEPVEGLSFIYILYCRNGSFYVGQTRDVQARLVLHSKGTGARHTRLLKDFVLVHVEGPMQPEVATNRELQLKKWSKAKKLALINGDLEKLKGLSRSQS